MSTVLLCMQKYIGHVNKTNGFFFQFVGLNVRREAVFLPLAVFHISKSKYSLQNKEALFRITHEIGGFFSKLLLVQGVPKVIVQRFGRGVNDCFWRLLGTNGD